MRTLFYTREVMRHDVWAKSHIGGGVATNVESSNSADTSWDGNSLRRLDDIADSVPWQDSEIAVGMNEEVGTLATHPRFQWQLDSNQESQCSLCTALVMAVKSLSRAELPVKMMVRLSAGPFLQNKDMHRCFEVKELSSICNFKLTVF
jgi:hypothetical protein